MAPSQNGGPKARWRAHMVLSQDGEPKARWRAQSLSGSCCCRSNSPQGRMALPHSTHSRPAGRPGLQRIWAAQAQQTGCGRWEARPYGGHGGISEPGGQTPPPAPPGEAGGAPFIPPLSWNFRLNHETDCISIPPLLEARTGHTELSTELSL